MLIDNPRFQQEYKEFSEKISRIVEESKRAEMNKLLQTLVNEVKNIDRGHQDMLSGRKLPSHVSDHRNSLISIRQQLARKIESYEKAGLIK